MALSGIDALDEKILAELLKDCRRSWRAIAKKLRVSTSTVVQRVKKLEARGVVLGYAPRLDYEKLGFDLKALIEIHVKGQPLPKVEERIAAFDNVVSVYDLTGEFDAMALVQARNRRDLSSLVKKIIALEGVERTNTHVILGAVKENRFRV